MPKLSLQEASLLSVGADPRSVKEEQIVSWKRAKKAGRKLWSACAFLPKQRDVIEQCNHHTGQGYPSHRNSKVKEWIDEVDLPVHPKFFAGLETRLASKVETPQTPSPTSSQTSQERATLLKLVAAVASEQYGYTPNAVRSEVGKNVKDDLKRIGQSMDVKTIRNWIRDGLPVMSEKKPYLMSGEA